MTRPSDSKCTQTCKVSSDPDWWKKLMSEPCRTRKSSQCVRQTVRWIERPREGINGAADNFFGIQYRLGHYQRILLQVLSTPASEHL